MSSIAVSRRNMLGLAAAATAVTVTTAAAGPASASASAADPAEIAAWIDRRAHRLRTTDPTEPLTDLRGLRHVVGSATVVGLGEAAHGSRELFRVKHRMVRYLVEHMGFRTVGFEQDFAWGTVIDQYVRTGEGDPRELVRGMSSPLWATEEILDLITWMRAYNTEHEDQVRFFGTDLLVLQQLSFDRVRAFVGRAAPDRRAELESQLGPLDLTGPYYQHFQWYAGRTSEEQLRLVEHGEAVVGLLESIDAGSSDMECQYARQHARAITGWYEYYRGSASLRPNRERFIADSVAWWKRLHGGRIAYWAANVHTGAAAETTFEMPGDTSTGAWAGSHLRERFGRRYVSIGTAFQRGTITSGWAPPAPVDVAAPPAHLLEAVLGRAEAPDYLLDLREHAPRPVREWLAGPAQLRMVHPSYPGGDDAAGHTMSVDALSELFDAIVHIRDTTASRLLR